MTTRKGKTLIDHENSNIYNKLIHFDIINTYEISGHDDTPYTICNIIKASLNESTINEEAKRT